MMWGLYLGALLVGATTSSPASAKPPLVARAPGDLMTPTLRVVLGGPLPLVILETGQAPGDAVQVAAALDDALARLTNGALPQRFAWQPAASRPALLSLVQARLARPGSGWDARRGAPMRGSAYRTLAADVLAAVQTSAIGAAFARHGYRLETAGHVAGVEVGRVAGRGHALLPTEIADMGLIAIRAR